MCRPGMQVHHRNAAAFMATARITGTQYDFIIFDAVTGNNRLPADLLSSGDTRCNAAALLAACLLSCCGTSQYRAHPHTSCQQASGLGTADLGSCCFCQRIRIRNVLRPTSIMYRNVCKLCCKAPNLQPVLKTLACEVASERCAPVVTPAHSALFHLLSKHGPHMCSW